MRTCSSCSNDQRHAISFGGCHKRSCDNPNLGEHEGRYPLVLLPTVREAKMNFELTEEQRLIQDTARRFAAEEIAPTLEQEEAKHEFRTDRVAKMGGLGFFSCALPEELGGSGMGFMESALM